MTRVLDPVTEAFAADVRAGLRSRPKQLPPKYFYDPLGSALFDAICRLPWYRVTRSELALIEQHREAIVRSVRAGAVLELGCGNGEKLECLASTLAREHATTVFHVVDVSASALANTVDRMSALGFTCVAHQATFESGLEEVAAQRRGGASMLVLFLGSNIGNFDADGAAALLRAIRVALEPGDRLLLGADLVKPEQDLLVAYDDPLGVTGAFNKNLLLRINRELGGDFDLDRFEHRALWNANASRIEMHLVSRGAQRVHVAGAAVDAEFAAGESIWTESSYKYEPDQVRRIGKAAGFRVEEQWLDLDARFALTLFGVRA